MLLFCLFFSPNSDILFTVRICKRSVYYLGEGVFWEVLVGEVTGLDQLAGDLGVCRISGLPIVAWKGEKKCK